MEESIYILGISAYYHDSAAAIIKNGEIIAAAQEERFSRKKNDSQFPSKAILFCLKEAGINLNDCKSVVYYEKPFDVFDRIIKTFLMTAPRGAMVLLEALRIWIKRKLLLKKLIIKELQKISKIAEVPNIQFSKHHLSHAAAAFYPSPFKNAAILCMDGVGEWATTTLWKGEGTNIEPIWEICFPNSIGLLYSAFTYYCGFKVNSGEYKLMGLAPYGEPIYSELIKSKLIDIKEDGTFRLNMSFFKFHRGFSMTSTKFHKLFAHKPRKSFENLEQFHMNIAASIQLVIEEIIYLLAKNIKKETGQKNLCLSGGVALNCVANGKLLNSGLFDEIWIQPASGDGGSAVGAALASLYQYFNFPRLINKEDSMKGGFLGPSFTNYEIKKYLTNINASFDSFEDKILFPKIAHYIDEGKVIGWFAGRMEFGPRALGSRSILGDPRNKKMQSIMNLKIKFRESFRPFAPSVQEQDVSKIFEMNQKSPYMLFVASVKNKLNENFDTDDYMGLEKLNIMRSEIPAVTHVDYTSRIQTVSHSTNPRYFNLISEFKKATNCLALINTSFNVRGEPIVCSPQDAFRCFMRTDMDILVLENQLLIKDNQNKSLIKETFTNEFIED